MRIVRFENLVAEPWKNGGGLTRQVTRVADDRGSGWRLSLAKISRNGPFSFFPGFRRILTLVGPAPVTFDLPHETLVLKPFATVTFDGSDKVHARLTEGPAHALNIIWRPQGYAACVSILEEGSQRTFLEKPGETTILHCLSGHADVKDARVLPGDTAIDIVGEIKLTGGAKAALIHLAVC